MTKLAALIIILLFYNLSFALETVSAVDLNRAMGTWFEIAAVPNPWQIDCYKNTRSIYSANEDGTFHLEKFCIKKNGRAKKFEATGEVTNPNSRAEYRVAFFPLLQYFGWFTGEYKMLIMDENYRYAVLGEDNLEYGWILSRRPNIPPSELADIEIRIRRLGYDSCKFKITIQEHGPLNRSMSLCEAVGRASN